MLFPQKLWLANHSNHDPLAITVQDVRSKIDVLEEACGNYKQLYPQLKLSGKYAWEPHPKVIESLRMQLE